MDIVEEQHQAGTKVQLLEDINIGLEHLDKVEDNLLGHPKGVHRDSLGHPKGVHRGSLGHPKGVHRGSLGQLSMQVAVEDRLPDIEDQGRVKLKGKPRDKVALAVACMATLKDKQATRGKNLDSLKEDTEVVIKDKDNLGHHQLEASNNLEEA